MTAGVAACLFPLLVVAGGMPAAATAAILLAGLLPAVVAADVARAAHLPRAAGAAVLITGVVLSAGALRGLPAAPALLALAIVAAEAVVAAGRRGRALVLAVAAATGAGILAASQLRVGAPAPFAADLALAALALCGGLVTLRHLGAQIGRRAASGRGESAFQQHADRVLEEALLEIDSKGAVQRAGANTLDVLGLAPDALEGRGLFDLTLVADRPALLNAINAGSRADAARQTLRFRLRSAAAGPMPQHRWVEMKIAGTGKDACAIASLRDVSADVVEQEQRAAAAEETASALRTRSAFLATVNHELRTPLNAIVGFSDILANPVTTPKDQAQVRDYARIVNEAGLDLLRMVSAMIDITRIDSGIYGFEPEEQELKAIVESAVEAFRQEPEAKGRIIRVSVDSADARSVVDSRALRSALGELLSNAVKFGRGRDIDVTVSRNAQGASIAVRDRGDGIPQDKLAQLEQAFSRLDDGLGRDKGGIGLGLSLVRGLMTLHGGSVRVESKTGQGTRVILRFPTSTSAAAPGNVLTLATATQRSAHAAEPTHKKERRRA